MIDKSTASAQAAVADIFDGATVMIGGFGTAGMPDQLIDDVALHKSRIPPSVSRAVPCDTPAIAIAPRPYLAGDSD